MWCDSTIALTWIQSPFRYETFIANRVQKVQEFSNDYIWDHVDSQTNAADVLSRGIAPSLLKSHDLWWKGPHWLHSNWEPWSSKIIFLPIPDLKLGVKKTELYSYVQVAILKFDLFVKYSSLTKLIRVTAYMMRFAHRVYYSNKETGPLSFDELKCAKTLLIKLAQGEYFNFEIRALQAQQRNSQNISPVNIEGSEISHLTPFLDQYGILRVGGRLEDAPISWDQKNPILLHPQHPLTTMIIRSEHITHLHAGQRLLKSVLRRNYWVLRQHGAIQNCIRKCIKCTNLRAMTQSQTDG